MSGLPQPPHHFPTIPEGSGILPIAENLIEQETCPESEVSLGQSSQSVIAALPPQPDAAAPSPFEPLSSVEPEVAADLPELNDALEQTYRHVLARALALAACGLFVAAFTAASVTPSSFLDQGLPNLHLLSRAVLVFQVLFMGLCSRFIDRLSIGAAAILLFVYAGFCALEFSVLFAFLTPAVLGTGFLCAGLMYGAASVWGFYRHSDLSRPVTGIFLILAGGVLLFIVNSLLQAGNAAWTFSALAVVVFAILFVSHAKQIRDFYQDFDGDNIEGWKASVLGALFLLVNSLNIYLLAASLLERNLEDTE